MWFKIYHTKINSEQPLSYTNSLHTNLQFKPTHEINNTIHILLLLIHGNTQGLDIDIYRKPISLHIQLISLQTTPWNNNWQLTDTL